MVPIVFGLAGLGGLTGVGVEKFEHDVAKDLEKYMKGDRRHIVVRAQIGIEMFWGTVPNVRILAEDFTCATLPFRVEKGRSRYGRVRRLHVDMRNFDLKSLHVDEMTVDIPKVRFDLAYALSQHHFRPSGSGTGPFMVRVKFSDLETYATKKFPQIANFKLRSDGPRLNASGEIEFAGLKVPFQISGTPQVQEGSKLVLGDPSFVVNGKALDPQRALAMFRGFSTLLDLNRDLGTAGGIKIKSFEVSGDTLIGKGQAEIPEKRPSDDAPLDPTAKPEIRP